jgi:hypothetical protein
MRRQPYQPAEEVNSQTDRNRFQSTEGMICSIETFHRWSLRPWMVVVDPI